METPTLSIEETRQEDTAPECPYRLFRERNSFEEMQNSTYAMYSNFDPVQHPDAESI